jgi:hypothetical protein
MGWLVPRNLSMLVWCYVDLPLDHFPMRTSTTLIGYGIVGINSKLYLPLERCIPVQFDPVRSSST